MSTLEVNKITPSTGTNITLGDSGDTFTIPSGVTITNNGTQTGFGGTNTPNFGVYGSGTSVSSGAWTKIAFQNEVYDTDGAFDNSTNYRFTVPSGKGGKYFFNLVITPDNGVTFTDWRAELYKNGSSGGLANGFFNFISDTKNVSGDFPTITGSCVVNLNAGDYIEVYGYHTSGASRTFNWPFFQGFKLVE